MLTTDRDLLRLDPRVFFDAHEEGDVLLTGEATISGDTLTDAAADFEEAGIDAGHIVIIDAEAFEVIERTGATTLRLSRPRVSEAFPATNPQGGSNQSYLIRTFARVIAVEEDRARRVFGLRASDQDQAITDDMILNPADLADWVAHQAMAMLLDRAAARAPDDPALRALAARAKRLAEARRQGLTIQVDLDGDGQADLTRRPGVILLRPW